MDIVAKLVELIQELFKIYRPNKLTPTERLKIGNDYINNSSRVSSNIMELAYEIRGLSLFEAYYGFEADAEMRKQIVKLHLTSNSKIKASTIRAAYHYLKLDKESVYVKIPISISRLYSFFEVAGIIFLFFPFLILFLDLKTTIKLPSMLLVFGLGILLLIQTEPVLRAKQIQKYLREKRKNEIKFREVNQQEPLKLGEAEIKPVKPNNKRLRPYGLCTGEFRVPDDFNAPLPEEIIKQFEGQ